MYIIARRLVFGVSITLYITNSVCLFVCYFLKFSQSLLLILFTCLIVSLLFVLFVYNITPNYCTDGYEIFREHQNCYKEELIQILA